MNLKKINEALDVIEQEYMKLENSIDRYNLRENVITRLNEMRTRMQEFIRNGDSPETTLIRLKVSSLLEEYSGVKREYINEGFENNYTKGECRNELGIDDLDWIEFIMAVEDNFDIEFPMLYEDDDTTLNSLIVFIVENKRI